MTSPYFSGFWGGFWPKKAGPPLAERISRALANGPIVGRYDLAKELWPSGWTLEDIADLNRTLNRMIQAGEVVETKREVPGAHQFASAVEFVYTKGADSVAAGRVTVLSEDGYTWKVYKNGRLIDEYPV